MEPYIHIALEFRFKDKITTYYNEDKQSCLYCLMFDGTIGTSKHPHFY